MRSVPRDATGTPQRCREDRHLAEKQNRRKIICGGCGERVLEETAMEAYRTAQDGYTRFRDHPTAGGTLAYLCPHCYDDWDVATDGQPENNERR